MTNSMIPYTFVPGTKAKAAEVNANFVSVAQAIAQNNESVNNSISTLSSSISNLTNTKADKSELVTNFAVTQTGKSLNGYRTVGTYVFTSAYAPSNPPKGTYGTLVVMGTSDSVIKQVWYPDDNSDIYTRYYENSAWSVWVGTDGIGKLTNPGYLKMPNGCIVQWGTGYESGNPVTFPTAFTRIASVMVTKLGQSPAYERSDSGITDQSTTGFTYVSNGVCNSFNWVAAGY